MTDTALCVPVEVLYYIGRGTTAVQAQSGTTLRCCEIQILPHLAAFCLKASHRYDFLPSPNREPKMRNLQIRVTEWRRSLTPTSHLPFSWARKRSISSPWQAGRSMALDLLTCSPFSPLSPPLELSEPDLRYDLFPFVSLFCLFLISLTFPDCDCL